MPLALPVLGTDPRGEFALVPPAMPAQSKHQGRLIDAHGRTIRDLRLSITDRCNFRCVYCLDPGVDFLPARALLTVDEFLRAAAACVSLGVTRIRITGGEPTLHPRLTEIIHRLAALPIDDLSMTTNGARSDEASLRAWHAAGLRRLTVSIDSVRPERFAGITRSATPLATVLEGIETALRVGLDPVRLNAVIIRGVNDDDIVDLAGLARDFGVEMRFIEFMPLDSGHAWGMDRVVPADEIIAAIESRYPLVPLGRPSLSSTALDFAFADAPAGAPRAGRIGIIAPVTRPFCGACSRLRITADGKVRPCLFSREEWDLTPLLRSAPPAPAARLAEFLQDAVWTKQAGHDITAAGFAPPPRSMSAIGG